jgi:precorrin-6A/cobalt-precorrin-6A reductase
VKILLLGGTSEAKAIAKKLIALELDVIYSVAGLVRLPKLDCKIIQGGFSRFSHTNNSDGLTEYLLTEKIDYLLDATHPFAINMSQQAVYSAQKINIPYCAFVRPEWKPQEGDDWSVFDNEAQLLNALALAVNAGSKNIFYTRGQIDRTLAIELDEIAELNEIFGPARYIVRSAKETELPQYSKWIQAVGPFSFDDEKTLLEKYEIDLIVCKNSGGEATNAKLEAARELGIRVLMLQRPAIVNEINNGLNKAFNTVDECFEFIREKCSSDSH